MQILTRLEAHLCVLSQGAVCGGEGESHVLHVPVVVAQEEQLLVQLRVQRGQVVQVAALAQQLLQEEARKRQLQQDALQAAAVSPESPSLLCRPKAPHGIRPDV